MSRRPRRNHTPAFKAKVALAAIKGDRTAGAAGGAVRRPPQSDHVVEGAARGRRSRCVRFRRRQRRRAAGRRREVAARQDRRADAGERFFGGSARQSRFAERKAMIDREHDLPITKQAEVLRHQPWQCLLSAAPGAGSRPRDHATSRPAASGVSFRRLADVARPAGRRGVQDRPSSREDADAADGDRGALSPSAHDEARARAQDLSISAARHAAITRPNQVWAMDISVPQQAA